jgi:RNA polymerase primary sigma factor
MDSLDIYLGEIDNYPILSSEKQIDLAIQAKAGDQLAKNLLVKSNLRFVVSIAKQYQGQGVPLEDLISEGNIGILLAIDNFDYRKAKFLTYAGWWIRKCIMEAITENNRSVRIPTNRVAILQSYQQTTNELYQELERPPVEYEILERLGIKSSDVINQSSASLFQNNGDGLALIDLVENENTPRADYEILREAVSQELRNAMYKIPRREREILKLYFGFDVERTYTLEEIGEKMKLTRERVRQLKHKGLRHLRRLRRRNQLEGLRP